MKKIFVLFFISNLCLGQVINREVDEFTSQDITTFEIKPGEPVFPIVEYISFIQTWYLDIRKIRKVNDLMLMTISTNGYYNQDSYLWFIFEDGEKFKFEIELYGGLVNDQIYNPISKSYYTLIDFKINKEFIDKLSKGGQVKTLRKMSTEGYKDLQHTGYKNKGKESRRKEFITTWFTNVKEYLEKDMN